MELNSANVMLAGGSGLVGGLALHHLLDTDAFSGNLVVPSRRPLPVVNARVINVRADLSNAQADGEIIAALHAQAAPLGAFVSCLGTTIKAAGSREAFIAVDRDLVLRLAQLAFQQGARHGVLVSSVGASRQSGNFYLRVKGEVEDAFEKIGFDRVDILQPGLLLGDREERRPAEAAARVIAPLGNLLLWGRLRRYRALDANQVALAIAHLLLHREPGTFTHTHAEITRLCLEG